MGEVYLAEDMKLGLYPNDFIPHNNLSLDYQVLGNFEDSLKEALEAAYSPAHVLAYLCLGRALAVNGDTTGARKAYQDLFALWKDADNDLPVLVEAHKEYESLR